jgi:virulence-associated protein VapD
MGLNRNLGNLTEVIKESSGKIGIGVTPENKLQVTDNLGSITDPTVYRPIANFYSGGNSSAFGLTIGSRPLNANVDQGGYVQSNSSVIYRAGLNHIFQSGGSFTESMRIFSNGNIYIGSSSSDAGYKLDVNGTTRIGSALTVNTDGGFGIARTGNNAGSTVVNIIGSSQSSTSAQLNLTQVWNGVSYPVVLRNTYNTTAGAASSVFTLSTSQYNGSIGGAELTERFRIDGNTGNIGIGTANTPSEKLTLDSGNIKLGTQGRVIFNRADNAIFTQLYDAGAYFVLDNRNGNGFDFQSAGTSHMRILPDGSTNNKSVKTQYAAGYSDIGSTFYVDFVAYQSSVYKIMSGITHWSAGYGAYLETIQFNDAYTNISNIVIANHTSVNGGSWSISRPNNYTIRVTHNAGTYAAYGNWWIEVIGT